MKKQAALRNLSKLFKAPTSRYVSKVGKAPDFGGIKPLADKAAPSVLPSPTFTTKAEAAKKWKDVGEKYSPGRLGVFKKFKPNGAK